MLHSHLKQGFRLNRTLGFALLAFEVMLLLTVQFSTPMSDLRWTLTRLGLMAAATIVFMLLNEVSLRSFKQHPRMDDLTLEKLSLLLPLAGGTIVAICYLLSGQLGIFLFSGLVMLEAQLFGHNGVARVMTVLAFLLFAASIPMGYPFLLGFSANTLPAIPMGFKILIMMVPATIAASHYGNIVALMFRSTTNKVTRLQSLAATDALTGLINRRQFNSQLDTEIARATRYRSPLSLALFDIDDFKKINDFYGHPTGDRILKELGSLITQNVREADTAARYGGEEFALILPETGQIDAYELLERLRAMIERTVFCLPDNPMTVTISVGVAQLDSEAAKSYEIIEKADVALYEAKKKGKNQVVYGALTPPKVNYPPFIT